MVFRTDGSTLKNAMKFLHISVSAGHESDGRSVCSQGTPECARGTTDLGVRIRDLRTRRLDKPPC
jgi:hypothetical protein